MPAPAIGPGVPSTENETVGALSGFIVRRATSGLPLRSTFLPGWSASPVASPSPSLLRGDDPAGRADDQAGVTYSGGRAHRQCVACPIWAQAYIRESL